MSSNTILRFLKNIAFYLGDVVVITVTSVVAIQGIITMGISLYPDLVEVVAIGNKGTLMFRVWMSFGIFIQLIFSCLMFNYAHRAYTRLKEFKWE